MKKYIPNTITCCNLISGAIATGLAFEGSYKCAMLMIILGAVFDFFDGMSARLLHVSSSIGKELDSLADDITFGLAPSAILFSLLKEMSYPDGMTSLQIYVPYVAFLISAFSALRLAKFNLDDRQSTSFIGVPTPANALFWASLVVWQHDRLVDSFLLTCTVVALIFICCYLLVAELPLFALKFKNLTWKDNWRKFIFLAGCLPCFLLGYGCFAVIIVWYVALSIVLPEKK